MSLKTAKYCSIGDELLETEEMIRANSLAMKDVYRKRMHLLTSKEIIEIRESIIDAKQNLC